MPDHEQKVIDFYTKYWSLPSLITGGPSKEKVDWALIKRIDITNKCIFEMGSGYPTDALKFCSEVREWFIIDICPAVVDGVNMIINRRKIENVKVWLANAKNIPFHNDRFDVVCDFSSIDHISVDRDKVMSEYYRILKPNGFLLLSVDLADGRETLDFGYTKWFTEKEVKDIVKSEFEIKEIIRGEVYKPIIKKSAIQKTGDYPPQYCRTGFLLKVIR